jgi:aldose 1-epimerase
MEGRDGIRYAPYFGICLETQIHPDAINHGEFPSPILRAGEVYGSETLYRFPLPSL